jgi:hypothetical protein
MKFSITLEGYEIVDREVKNGNSSGRIFVPPGWKGKKVKVVLLEPLED